MSDGQAAREADARTFTAFSKNLEEDKWEQRFDALAALARAAGVAPADIEAIHKQDWLTNAGEQLAGESAPATHFTAHPRTAMADDWVYLTDLSSGYGYYANTKTHIGGIASLKADLRRALDDPAVSHDIPGLDEDIDERVTVQELQLRDKLLSTDAVPLMTQDNASSDPGSLEDDHELEALVEAFPDCISMSYALKNKHAELYMYEKRRGINPYELANVMKANVDETVAMAAGARHEMAVRALRDHSMRRHSSPAAARRGVERVQGLRPQSDAFAAAQSGDTVPRSAQWRARPFQGRPGLDAH